MSNSVIILINIMESRLAFLKAMIEKLNLYQLDGLACSQNLMSAKLHETMYPLDKQIQVAIDHARFSLRRIISDQDCSCLPKTGLALSDLAAGCDEALDFIYQVKHNFGIIDESRKISFTKDGRKFNFDSLEDYLALWTIPNIFFHAVTAYNIMRYCHFSIGKADFLGAEVFFKGSNLVEKFSGGGSIENA